MGIEELEFVNKDQAFKLKQLGFDWNCKKAIDKEGSEINWTTKHFFAWKPTVSLALKWLRSKKNIFVNINLDQTSNPKFAVDIIGYEYFGNFDLLNKDELRFPSWGLHREYEEAESCALDFILDYLLKKETDL